jgi:hypothetical protein
MSVEKINDKVDGLYSTNEDKGKVLKELDPLFEDAFKSDAKGSINAENIAVKVSKKTTSKRSEPHGENSRSESQEQSSEVVGQKQGKKSGRVIEFFGTLAKGVFGSSKKQEEELRRLELDIRLLNEQRHGLTSEIKKNMFDAMAIESDITNTDGFQNLMNSDVSRSKHANRENNQIDDRARLNTKEAERLARISDLRKKGVK